MFQNAVKNHSAHNKSQQTTQKTLPPSSNRGILPPLNANRTVPNTRVPKGSANSNVLQPSPKSAINSVRPKVAEHSAGQKRKYSSGLVRTLTNENSFSDQSAFLDVPQPGSLQDAIYLDENNFEDDSDSSVEFAAPILNTPNQPQQLKPPSRPSAVQSSSDTPIPWSSSPLEHKTVISVAQVPSKPSDVSAGAVNYPRLPTAKTTTNAVSYPNLRPDPKESGYSDTADSRPSKRRTLPWLQYGNKTLQHGSTSRYDENDKKQDNRLKRSKVSGKETASPEKNLKRNDDSGYTPLARDDPGTKYPWNATASSVKDEQKALRKHYKMRVSKTETDGDSVARPDTKKLAPVFLSDEQKKVASMVVNQGASVFFTGSAGTGKSVLMREIIRQLRERYKKEPDRVAVTASTGLAACNIGGVTLHSFAGIGLGKEDAPELIRKIKRNTKSKTRWQRTKVLIIDEVSMVDGVLFDKLEQIARSIRCSGRPFGGLQLVVTGDFFQLPPVPDRDKAATFSFDANTWKTTIEHTILLTHVFRQRDPVFANMLNEMRVGKLAPKSREIFQKLKRPLQFLDDFEATEL
jgi:ATP-dependent DNA helicase PIF1